jgi:hypothetical protein
VYNISSPKPLAFQALSETKKAQVTEGDEEENPFANKNEPLRVEVQAEKQS